MLRVNLDIVRHMPLSVAVIDLYSVLLITLPIHEPYKRRFPSVVSTRSWRALMCVCQRSEAGTKQITIAITVVLYSAHQRLVCHRFHRERYHFEAASDYLDSGTVPVHPFLPPRQKIGGERERGCSSFIYLCADGAST